MDRSFWVMCFLGGKMKVKLFLLSFIFIFLSCDLFIQKGEDFIGKPEMIEIEIAEQTVIDERKWTLFIYMCADNNLESSAIEDMYEMECSNLNTDETTVVILLDRSPLYNSSNNNWTETKMYKLKSGCKENPKKILSEEIECKELGLVKDLDVELDMSDENTLSSAMQYVFSKYPASNLGLIMWGHGSGWKNDESENLNNYKGFAFDESSSSYMSLPKFGIALEKGLEGKKLDFLGFDTCYGAELEVLYELKNYVKYACGSEGLISTDGWNYTKLFNSFQISEKKNANDLLDACLLQFSETYTNSSRASFCVCDVSKIDSYFKTFDNFMALCGHNIVNSNIRDSVFEKIYASNDCNTERYTYGKDGYDIYLDCYSLCENLTQYFCSQIITEAFHNFLQAENECVLNSWASDRDRGGIGVYFQTLSTGGLIQTFYNSNYIKGKAYDQSKFVMDSNGYVPNVNLSESFLDKLFYTRY